MDVPCTRGGGEYPAPPMWGADDKRSRGRRGVRLASVAALALAALTLAAPASSLAATEGTISGVVTDGSGPVAGALVVALGTAGGGPHTTTAANGTYSLQVPPDTYEVGAEPPRGSSDGFDAVPGVVVGEGQAIVTNVALAPSEGSGEVAGNASYGDHSPDAGVAVWVFEQRYENGPVNGETVYTDEAGNWKTKAIPAGIYSASYSVNAADASSGQVINDGLGSELIFVRPGVVKSLSRTLTGNKPQGVVEATVTAAEGWQEAVPLELEFPAGHQTAVGDQDGTYRMFAPTGSYTLKAAPGFNSDDADASQSVTVTDGRVTKVNLQLAPLPARAGVSSQNTGQDLAWLNHQRARWGLPANIGNVQLWSDACAAHDAFEKENNILGHGEAGRGFSPGGNWASLNAVLSEGGYWAEEANPWLDAPYHLEQLFTPGIGEIGLDDSGGYQCATTWPGIVHGLFETRRHPGTVYTFPGDGTSGVPPVELAAEFPSTPNEDLGVPDLAGRELMVYETGAEFGENQATVVNASLSSSAGAVPVKWTRGDGEPGAIIIPTEPLRPFTTYQASVTLAPFATLAGSVPELTHTWSFSTGKNNPNGHWEESAATPAGTMKSMAARRVLHLSWRRGRITVRGLNFQPGRVVVKRKLSAKDRRRHGRKITLTAEASAKGTFVARFRWPRRRISVRAFQGGKATGATYNPKLGRHRHGGKAQKPRRH